MWQVQHLLTGWNQSITWRIKMPFLKQIEGLLMIGKGVQITHGKQISFGKLIKFENYAKIHGLFIEGRVFGNDVTIGKGVMISPSSCYDGDIGKGFVIGDNSSINQDAYVWGREERYW
jgi:NDP-sugar pyrophosphorylase family protein